MENRDYRFQAATDHEARLIEANLNETGLSYELDADGNIAVLERPANLIQETILQALDQQYGVQS